MKDPACILVLFVALALVLGGCGRDPAPAPTTDAPVPAPTTAPTTDAPAPEPRPPLGPEELWEQYKLAFIAKNASQILQLATSNEGDSTLDEVCYWTKWPGRPGQSWPRLCSEIPLAPYLRSLYANITGAIVVHHESLYTHPNYEWASPSEVWGATLVWSSPESGIGYHVDSFVIYRWNTWTNDHVFLKQFAHQPPPLNSSNATGQFGDEEAISQTGLFEDASRRGQDVSAKCDRGFTSVIASKNTDRMLERLGGNATVILYDHTNHNTNVAKTAEDRRQLFTVLFAADLGEVVTASSWGENDEYTAMMLKFTKVHVVGMAIRTLCEQVGVFIISVVRPEELAVADKSLDVLEAKQMLV